MINNLWMDLDLACAGEQHQQPIRGCRALSQPLLGLAVSPRPGCRQTEAGARFCSCATDLCNLHLYNFSRFEPRTADQPLLPARVKRHRQEARRRPDTFLFPFQPRQQETDQPPVAAASAAGVRCYSCGSLFGRAAPACAEFDAANVTQRERCGPGEVCLLYTWAGPDQRGGGSQYSDIILYQQ